MSSRANVRKRGYGKHNKWTKQSYAPVIEYTMLKPRGEGLDENLVLFGFFIPLARPFYPSSRHLHQRRPMQRCQMKNLMTEMPYKTDVEGDQSVVGHLDLRPV